MSQLCLKNYAHLLSLSLSLSLSLKQKVVLRNFEPSKLSPYLFEFLNIFELLTFRIVKS